MSEGTIVTFYSYKGGVGRTFALANIGALLSLWGYKTLCVDWDLEAPGLHLYFKSWLNKSNHHGLTELVQSYVEGEKPDWQKYVSKVNFPHAKASLYLMSAGLQDNTYIQRMQALNWTELYESHTLGNFLEELRGNWKETLDFVLIDSRTGISDIGSICTVQLPDLLVLLLTANDQSLYGSLNVLQSIEQVHANLPLDRAKLWIMPVVSRFEGRVEYSLAQEWLAIFAKALAPIYAEWAHKDVTASDLLNFTRIPYVPYWSFGEKLPVIEKGTEDPEDIGFLLETLASLVARKFSHSDVLIKNRDSFVALARRGPIEAGVLIEKGESLISPLELYPSVGEPRNPYKGLRTFTAQDARDFFGRDRLIVDLIERLRHLLTLERPGMATARMLSVIGPSSSGKSSVVLAGLLPHLQAGALPGSDEWVYLEPVVPGKHPIEALSLTLRPYFPDTSLKTLREDLEDDAARGLHALAAQLVKRRDDKVVLLVDQLEELFTQTGDEDERHHFLDLLVTATTEPHGPVIVLLTLRADFYDRPMRYPLLHQLIQAHQTSVLPMDIHDLRDVIEKPAALPDVGLTFEGDLVGDLLFEVQGQVGALPLLQFTLHQLFQRRSGRQLTLSAYRELGGVKGALTRHAEKTYSDLPSDEHRKLARALFVRLIDPGGSEQDTTRRRAALSEFTLDHPTQTRLMRESIDAFIAARLLTTNEVAGTTTIELSHEALIREWPRLAEWMHEARQDIRLQQTISKDASEWEQRNKPGDRLYRGSQLKEAQAWATRDIPSGNEAAFLRAGAVSRMRSLVSVIAVALILISSIGTASWVLTHQPPKPPDPTRVSNLLDNDKAGSLRYAIDGATEGSTITFDVSLHGTILLTSGDLNIGKHLSIRGPGAGILSISGGKGGYIVHVVHDAIVAISGLTFKDSNTSKGFINNEGTLTLSNSAVSGNTATGNGGGIFNGGTLTLSNSTVSGNTASDGGGIFNDNIGTLTLINSTVSGNTATGNGGSLGGGGIDSSGTLTLSNSTVSGNTASDGGGIFNDNIGTLTLSNSTVSGNTATGTGGSLGGGGIESSGTLTLTNSTVSGNTATGGGGIFIQSSTSPGIHPSIAQADLTFSTIYGNTAHSGGDIAIEDVALDSNGKRIKAITQISHVRISNSIVAGDPAHPGPDIVGMLTSSGYNLFQDNAGATFDPATSKQHSTDKALSVNDLSKLFAAPVGLLNNGGPTMTYALASGSPAIDAIPLDACHITVPIKNLSGTPFAQYPITTDQRGVKRPDGNEQSCDIGAYESSP